MNAKNKMLGLLTSLTLAGAMAAQDVYDYRFALNGKAVEDMPPMTFSTRDGKDTITIEVEGKDVEVRLNGDEMPEDRYVRKGNTIRCMDAAGGTVAILRLQRNGGSFQAVPKRKGHVSLGVTLNEIDDALAKHLELNRTNVFQITGVTEGKAADKGGLEKHDIVLEIEGKRPATRKRLAQILKAKHPGDSLDLVVLRRGEDLPLSITLGHAPYDAAVSFFNDALGNYQGGFQTAYEYPGIFADPKGRYEIAKNLQAKENPFWAYTNRGGSFPANVQKSKKSSGEHDDSDVADELEALSERLTKLEKLLEKISRKL